MSGSRPGGAWSHGPSERGYREHRWVWGNLTPAHLALARELATWWREDAVRKQVADHRYLTTPNGVYQGEVGAAGEIAMYVLNGWPVPPFAELIGDFKRKADVRGHECKTNGQRSYHLRLDRKDLTPPDLHSVVLLYVATTGRQLREDGRCAIVGWLPKGMVPHVWLRSEDEVPQMPRHCMVVRQKNLYDWVGVDEQQAAIPW